MHNTKIYIILEAGYTHTQNYHIGITHYNLAKDATKQSALICFQTSSAGCSPACLRLCSFFKTEQQRHQGTEGQNVFSHCLGSGSLSSTWIHFFPSFQQVCCAYTVVCVCMSVCECLSRGWPRPTENTPIPLRVCGPSCLMKEPSRDSRDFCLVWLFTAYVTAGSHCGHRTQCHCAASQKCNVLVPSVPGAT